MATKPSPERITDREVLERHLAALIELDPRLEPIHAQVGEVPLRLGRSGFAGLISIISAQLLSVASANAIHGRVEALLDDISPTRFLQVDETALRACGLSNGKYHTMRTVAEAELSGELDYDALSTLPLDEAMAALTQHKGIGPWTAELYLLFSVGHGDIFPSGDLALRKMVGQALGRKKQLDEKQVRRIVAKWSPYRGAAARLMWRYFAVTKQREGIISSE